MSLSSRCAVAAHALTLLARWEGERLLTSAEIADSLESNPVLVRRILGLLRAASLVVSAEGPEGGFRLARPASQISLYDAYAAVEDGRVLSRLPHPPSSSCVVGRHMQALLEEEFAAAEHALEQRLARTSIAQTLRTVLQREREAGAPQGA